MSVIGPRPALWNQDVLIAEREKYHANDVKPGLTGWAQINGRDELEIPVKAKLDGEYVEKESLLFDIKCFLGTIGSVLSSDGVVEGGTGELTKDHYQVDTLDMQDETWRDTDFSQYDVVYHVAGIAHADVGNVTEEQKQLYYKVNTDLTIEVVERARQAKVKQFIFMSCKMSN